MYLLKIVGIYIIRQKIFPKCSKNLRFFVIFYFRSFLKNSDSTA